MSFNSEILSVQPYLKKYIKSKIYCRCNAEDILQDVNSILVQKQNDFDESKSFQGWAFAIARFQIKKFLTKLKRNREDALDFNFDRLEFSKSYSSPLEKLLIKEGNKSTLDNINFILENKMSEREKNFFKYTRDGWNRSEIMNKMNLKQTNYYAYRRRINEKFKNYLCEV